MIFLKQKQKGFTLIELLVVISIISLLSSVVLSSLRDARIKAKDATIKQQVAQWAILANINYNEQGDYNNLQIGYITPCSNTGFGGNYATKFSQICNVLEKNAINGPGLTQKVYSGDINWSADKWSIMVGLNNGKVYCMGSSNRKGEYTSYSGQPGCYDNP